MLKSRDSTHDTELVKPPARFGTVEVAADGEGWVSHAGVALVVELADLFWLTRAMSQAMAIPRERRSAHDPGRVVGDVAVMLADGGDLDAYHDASGAQVGRRATVGRVRAGRAQARARVWDAGVRPETITLDIDAALVSAHSDKELAAGTYKHGYGFHPLGC